MTQNIANLTSFFQGEALRAQRQAPPSDLPTIVKSTIQKYSQIALSDLGDVLAAKPEKLLQTLENLRAAGEVEVFELGDSPVKFARLTSAGYASLAGYGSMGGFSSLP